MKTTRIVSTIMIWGCALILFAGSVACQKLDDEDSGAPTDIKKIAASKSVTTASQEKAKSPETTATPQTTQTAHRITSSKFPPDAIFDQPLASNVQFDGPFLLKNVSLIIEGQMVTLKTTIEVRKDTDKKYRFFGHLLKGEDIIYNVDHDLALAKDPSGVYKAGEIIETTNLVDLPKLFSHQAVDSFRLGLLDKSTEQRVWIKSSDAQAVDDMTALKWAIK